jgi:hypothetical protein
MGNGDNEGDASKGAMGNGNNEVGKASKWAVGSSHRQVKSWWATAMIRGRQAKAL